MPPKILGLVDPDHPHLVSAIKTMIKLGKPKEEIHKTLGAPMEIVDKYVREARDHT